VKKFLAILFMLLPAIALAQPPKDKTVIVPAPNVPGGKVVLVPRDQLRAGPGVKTARLPRGIRAAAESNQIPVPATWDWTKNNTIKMPIYGNNQYGDCYYVAPVKVFQMWNGMNGKELLFDTNAIVRRYLQLSGGDNGLSDSDVFPEVKAGIVGPNGPHKMLDVLIVPSTDNTALDLTEWAFGPHMFTFTVYSNFMNVGPGTVLNGNTGGVQGGHAVAISGKTADGKRKLETWGIQPSVLITDNWVRGVDPEFIACFSLEWFNSEGYAPNGEHYTTLAPLWESLGGKRLPASPFPPPKKPGPTAELTADHSAVTAGEAVKLTWKTEGATSVTLDGKPVAASGTLSLTPQQTTSYTLVANGEAGTTPATATVTVTVNGPPPIPFAGTLAQVVNGETIAFDPVRKVVTLPQGWTTTGGGVSNAFEAELKSAGVCPAAIAAALQLAVDLKAKAGMPVILTDLLALYAAYQSCQAQTSQTPVQITPAAFAIAGDCGTVGSFGACADANGFGIRHPFGGRFALAPVQQACGNATGATSYAYGTMSASFGECGTSAAPAKQYRFAPFGGRFRR
jgi:hypothetical protein